MKNSFCNNKPLGKVALEDLINDRIEPFLIVDLFQKAEICYELNVDSSITELVNFIYKITDYENNFANFLSQNLTDCRDYDYVAIAELNKFVTRKTMEYNMLKNDYESYKIDAKSKLRHIVNSLNSDYSSAPAKFFSEILQLINVENFKISIAGCSYNTNTKSLIIMLSFPNLKKNNMKETYSYEVVLKIKEYFSSLIKENDEKLLVKEVFFICTDFDGNQL